MGWFKREKKEEPSEVITEKVEEIPTITSQEISESKVEEIQSTVIDEKKNEQLIIIYNTGKYELYRVSIHEIGDETEKKFSINSNFDSEADEIFVEKIIQEKAKNPNYPNPFLLFIWSDSSNNVEDCTVSRHTLHFLKK